MIDYEQLIELLIQVRDKAIDDGNQVLESEVNQLINTLESSYVT